MMPLSPTRVAVIGAGPFGREHMLRLVQNTSVRLVAYLDPSDVEAAAALAIAPYAQRVSTIDEAINLDLDGVIIASASETHASMCSSFLEAGIPVLLEKPIATSLADAHALLKAEQNSSAFVLPGHILRFSDPYRRMRNRIRRGEIGTLLALSFTKHRTLDHDQRYPSSHPVLLTGIHDLDLALWFTSANPSSVRSTEVHTEGRSQPSVVVSQATLSDGVEVTFTNTWALAPNHEIPDRVEAFGTSGVIKLELTSPLTSGLGGLYNGVFDDSGDDSLNAELDHFLRLIRGEVDTPIISLLEAVNTLELANQIIQAGASK